MVHRAGWFGSVVALVASLAACGGGGGGGGGSSGPDLKAGVAVDPYVVGAVLQERTPAGDVVQESSASDASGAFAFSRALTAGNRVVTLVSGLHNGKPYAVKLAAVVDTSRTMVVVSPLTTLVASGAFTAEKVAALVDSALPGEAVTTADVLDDPMARVLDGTVTATDRRLLAANIAVGAALAITHGNAASADLPALVAAIAPKVLAALSLDGAPAALASAAAAVADYVAAVSTTPAEAAHAADAVSGGLITQLVGSASAGGCAAIVVSNGGLQAGTSAMTVAAHLAAGKAALRSLSSTHATDAALAALREFSAAAALADADGTASANEKQQAYFYGGLARLLMLAQPYSDATDGGLNDLGDLLDAYGLGGSNADRKSLDTLSVLECHDLLEPGTTTVVGESCGLKKIPSTAPRTRALQAFVAGQVATGLRAAIASFAKVPDDFTTTLDVGARTVELDAADAQLAKAVGQAMLAATELQYAYDLDVKLDDLQSRFGEEASSGGGTAGVGGLVPASGVRTLARLVTAPVRALTESEADREGPAQLLADYPKLLTLLDASALQNVRSDALAACATALHALDLLAAEKDDQSDDFFRIGGGERCAYDDATQDVVCKPIDVTAEIASTRKEIEQVQKILGAHGNYVFDMGTTDTEDDVTLAPDKFFAGVDLRRLLPTSWDKGASGSAPGLFPDATLGGFLVSAPFSLNADLDKDGSPDIFGFSYLVPSQIAGRTWWSGSSWPGTLSGTWTFDAGGSFKFHGWFYGMGIGNEQVDLSGTYTVVENVLTLTFAQTDVTSIAQLIFTADDVKGDWFGGSARYVNAEDASIISVDQDFSPYRSTF